MKTWQRCFRVGFVPQFSTAGLRALRKALMEDDQRLIQGATLSPPPLQCVLDWPAEAACPVAFTYWQGDHINTVGELEECFAKACHGADVLIGEPAGCRHVLNAWDEEPRAQMRAQLLNEVNRALLRREATGAASAQASCAHATATSPEGAELLPDRSGTEGPEGGPALNTSGT